MFIYVNYYSDIAGLFQLVKDQYIIFLQMLTINKKLEDNTLKIPSVQLFNQMPTLTNAHRHRNTFTAKLRPRSFLTSGKGSRLDNKGVSINHDQQDNIVEKEHKPTNQQVQGVLHQFDNLQLEDFLKVVIVGKSKLSETKSKQIIRSLNGTWFKNTDSNSPVNRLYCSLPIRKQKNIGITKNNEEQMRKWNLSEHFYKNYTPPNLFPKRKIGIIRHKSTQIKNELPISKLDIESEIKTKIAQKITSLRQFSQDSKRKRRPSSYYSSSKQNSTFKFFQEENSYLVGRKMVIHD